LGFTYMVDRMGLSIKDKRVLILGDGATSGTVRHAVFALGAGSIKIASRKPSIKPVINHPSKVPTSDMQPSEIQKPDIKPSDMPLCDCQIVGYDQDFSDINIVINTTSVGMFPGNGEKLINLEGMSRLEGVIDLIYNPFATALLLDAQDLNIKTSNGFPMLVAQATKGAELFLGRLPKGKTWEEWNETLIEHFEEKYYNKVLIGMPGSGKTTLGKALAQELNREFQDIDHIIEAREARSIPDIFKEEGEPYFRQLEVKVAKELGEKKSLVIATGGGMILQKEAMDALRQNGEIIWVKAPLDNLAQGGRPLSLGIKSLEKMWGEREPLYNKYANKIVYRGSED
jgi:shikimate dehydrogenase